MGPTQVWGFGKKKISRIGVISGGGSFALQEAADKGIDVLLIGEFKHGAYHTAKELGIHVIAAGHYQTETFGVKALMPVLKKKFGVDVVFLDAPTGL